MKAVLSVVIWIVSVFLTILLFFVVSFLVILLFPFDKKRMIAHRQCFWWADAIVRLNPYWHLEIKGVENIDHRRPYVIVANHQSLADIVVLYKTKMQFKWVAKESLFKLPFIGWNLQLIKHIGLKREKFGSIKQVYREAAQWLRDGVSVLFFPEGTRSSNDEIGKFKNGAFKLAVKEKRPILPIKIEGTRNAISKGNWIFKSRVDGCITVLPPIETDSFKMSDFSLLRDMVFERIASGGVY